jgi:hypothetical protein
MFGEMTMNRDGVSAAWRAVILGMALVQSCLLMAADAPAVFCFESEVETWKPRADTITVRHEEPGAIDSAGCLRIHGRIEGG